LTITEPFLEPSSPKSSAGAALGRKTWLEQIFLAIFLIVPFAAVAAAIPVAWGWGLTWHDAVIATVMYAVTGLGVTVGYHRHLTHHAFKARRPVRIGLAIAGSMALQASAVQWVADHRRHHRFSDKVGDPHSPWRYGSNLRSLIKGFGYAHVGWLFDWDKTDEDRYAPDVVGDPDMSWVSRTFSLWVVVSLVLSPLVGGLWSWSLRGALTAFFWGSMVRVCLLHHVTFSINSVCHIAGRRPFRTRDRSMNVWWLAIPSFGESWHNFHHAEPASARHGVRRLEIDTSAILIRVMEKLRWVSDVRWPDAAMIRRRMIGPSLAS
jgi:stearoyl-CoA desaturase (delta-9 desaturase)